MLGLHPNSRIKDLLPLGSGHSAMTVVLGNALYFKGAWCSMFALQFTKHDTFYLNISDQVHAPFMSSGEEQHIICRRDYKVLKLPYAHAHGPGGGKRFFYTYIDLLNNRHDLQSLLQKLSSNPAMLRASSIALDVKVPVGVFEIPKLRISYQMDAMKLLQDLELRLSFGYLQADLSGMLLTTLELVVEAVYHQSFVEVNEEGTEAAGATAIVGAFGSAAATTPVRILDFVADHPFLFMIKEDHSHVVVLGSFPSVTSLLLELFGWLKLNMIS